MAHVRIENVHKIYPPDTVAVQNANIEALDKEFLALVGPSGCGKSTLLRMIAGLESVTQGDIYIDERRVTDALPKDRDISMVFQNYALYPHMTVYKNMAFGLKMRKTPKREIERRVKNAAEILGIEPLLNRRPQQLSGGERQRAALGRAIVRDPKVFLFDEPLSNLDAQLRAQMRTELKKIHAQLEATMIYVTHDQTEAMTMGDRIIVLNEGVIQQIATPLHLYEQPKNRFVAQFIGNPPMNLIEGRMATREHRRVFEAPGIELDLPRPLWPALQAAPDGEIVLGVRPEHVRIDPEFTQTRPAARISAVVEAVEPLGSETLAYLNAEGSVFIAKMPPTSLPRVNERIDAAFEPEQIHFFNAASGESFTA